MNQKTFQAILTLGWFLWLAKQLAGFAKYAISSNATPAGMITLFGGVVLVGGALVISILQLRTPKKGLAIAMAIPCLLLLKHLAPARPGMPPPACHYRWKVSRGTTSQSRWSSNSAHT